MAIDDFFCHVCTIQRPQGTVVRGANGEILTPLTDLVTALPCRLATKTERMATPAGFVVLTVYSLFVPVNDGTKGLRANDVVSEIILDDLSTDGPYTVSAVIPHLGKSSLHHITLELERLE
jgi:hypothetical protein